MNNFKSGYKFVKTEGCKELLIIISILVITGFMAIVSASLPMCVARHLNPFYYIIQHLFWIVIGEFGLYYFSKFDYNQLRKYTFSFAFLVIMLLLIVKFTPLGVTINGAKRWLNLGFFQFQPSEFSKIALIMLLGNLFSLKREQFKTNLLKYLLTLGVMIFIVLKQPNLSMTLILLGIAFCMYISSGKTLKPLYVGFAIVISLFILIKINVINLSNYIEPFQLERIMNWSNSEPDIQGGGYQVFHSMVAISSGGIFGCGYGASKEKLGWLPESHTDFIFSVISEEMGFVGSLFIILLFLTLLYKGVNIASKCPNLYGRLFLREFVSEYFFSSLNVFKKLSIFSEFLYPLRVCIREIKSLGASFFQVCFSCKILL